MSDADWDMEYSKAYDLEQEIKGFCLKNGIKCPDIKPYARFWELKDVLKSVKNTRTYSYICPTCNEHLNPEEYEYCPDCGAKVE